MPFVQLLKRALLLYRGRGWLYSLTTLAVLAAQILVYFFAHFKHGDALDLLLITPILVTLVNAGIASDLCGEFVRDRLLFERVLERVWAVIIIDFILTSIFVAGADALATGDAFNILLGLAILLMSGTLFFADVYASTELQPSMLTILPFSFMRSSALAWQNGNIVRICYLIGLQAALMLMIGLIAVVLRNHHAVDTEFGANLPLYTLTAGPLTALFTVVYYDCIAREREALEDRR